MSSVERFFEGHDKLFVKQRKEMIEILVDWETKNQYEILDESQTSLGSVVERAGGFGAALMRGLLRSHRPLEIDVFDIMGEALLRFTRPFFFLFSTLTILTADGAHIGQIRRRFGVLYKKYDLVDATGRVFAHIRSPLWRLWTFKIFSTRDEEWGVISKKWGGLLREAFTDADTFMIDYQEHEWTTAQKAVIFSAAVSIDFDFFENNSKSGGVLGGFN